MTAEQLKTTRIDLGLSQADLSRATGISQPNIASMETGKRTITPNAAKRLTEGLNAALAERSARIEQAVLAAFQKPHLADLRRKHEAQQ